MMFRQPNEMRRDGTLLVRFATIQVDHVLPRPRIALELFIAHKLDILLDGWAVVALALTAGLLLLSPARVVGPGPTAGGTTSRQDPVNGIVGV